MDEAALKNQYMISIAQLSSEECGVPMSIFDNVCINDSNIFNHLKIKIDYKIQANMFSG